jgi:hypothetical protein
MAGVTMLPWRSRFYSASRKCGTSQLHLFKHAPDRSAIPPVADVSLRRSEPPLRAIFCREQMQQMASLLDHLVDERQQRRRNVDAERLRGLEVYHQLELGRLHNR